MVDNLMSVVDMSGANRWCIKMIKEKTIFEKDGLEYVIYWVKNFAVKLQEIKTLEETEWIQVYDFQKWYKETDYYLNVS